MSAWGLAERVSAGLHFPLPIVQARCRAVVLPLRVGHTPVVYLG